MRTYDFKAVSVSFAGITLQGFAESDGVAIDNESDAYSDVIGIDGETTRARTNDDRANVTIRLMQSSSANDQLSALHALDKLTPNGAGIGTFNCKDTNGTSLYNGEAAWIQKPPPVVFDRGVKEREWKIRVAKLVRTDGSNVGT